VHKLTKFGSKLTYIISTIIIATKRVLFHPGGCGILLVSVTCDDLRPTAYAPGSASLQSIEHLDG
jgi:hypothetical protein